MAIRKIKLKDQLGRVIRVPTAAAEPTTPAQPAPTPATPPSAAATLWRLIREIPANIQALAAGAGNLVAGSGVTLAGTLTNRLVGSGNVTISASGGGGDGWTLINDWSFAADGAVSEVVGNVSGYSEVIAVVRSVGMSVSGRRMFAVSTNGGSTWHTTYAAISTAGVETAATDVPMHLTDASAARSSYVRVALFPSGDTVTIDRPVNNTFAAFAAALPGVVNAVRVYPNSGTFTAGAVEIWAR